MFVPEFAKWLYKHRIVASNKLKIVKNVDVKNATYLNKDEIYKFENIVYKYNLTIDEKEVIVRGSYDSEPKYFDTEEYVNKN